MEEPTNSIKNSSITYYKLYIGIPIFQKPLLEILILLRSELRITTNNKDLKFKELLIRTKMISKSALNS